MLLLNFLLTLGVSSLDIQIFSSASKSKVPDVSNEKREIFLKGKDLYSILLPVKPCMSTKINLLLVNMKMSLNKVNPSSIFSSSTSNLPYFSLSFSDDTTLAFPSNLLNNPIVFFMFQSFVYLGFLV